MALNRLRIPWDWEKLVAQGQTRWRKSHWGLRCLQWSMQIRWPCRCTEASESHSTMLPRCHTDPGTTASQHVAKSERGLGRSYHRQKLSNTFMYQAEPWASWILRPLLTRSFLAFFEGLRGAICCSRHRGENKTEENIAPTIMGYRVFLKLCAKEYRSFSNSGIKLFYHQISFRNVAFLPPIPGILNSHQHDKGSEKSCRKPAYW